MLLLEGTIHPLLRDHPRYMKRGDSFGRVDTTFRIRGSGTPPSIKMLIILRIHAGIPAEDVSNSAAEK